MPKKKKGSKKKGGKKKGGKKKGGKKEPKLTQTERFVQFQITTRTDAIAAWQARRTEMLEQNQALEARLKELEQKRMAVVAGTKSTFGSTQAELRALETSAQSTVQEALSKKRAFVSEQEGIIADCKVKCRELDDERRQTLSLLTELQHYKAVRQYERAEEIDLLQQQLVDMGQEFEFDKQTIADRFGHAKRRFSQHLDDRLTAAKDQAADVAMSQQPSRQQAAYLDHGWLRGEVMRHAEEKARLEVSCLQLERETLNLLRDLFPGAEATRFGDLGSYKASSEQQLVDELETDSDESDDGDEDSDDGGDGDEWQSSAAASSVGSARRRDRLRRHNSLSSATSSLGATSSRAGMDRSHSLVDTRALVVFPKLAQTQPRKPALAQTLPSSSILSLPVIAQTQGKRR
eukprot:m.50313 g.50313  ORF g.50313 m.50313 type:complete len:404 (-) comp12145_c0_seq3:176-1387(-)